MIFLTKSQPAPASLLVEKVKASGSYKCDDVIIRLKSDFKNKCYICEYKEPESINIEHFIPHKGNVDLKFDWDNLFWSCFHCNNLKSSRFTNILNCIVPSDNVETCLKYQFNPFPYEQVKIEALEANYQTLSTKDLLENVYNGTTPLKKIEAANLRNKLLEEIVKFQSDLIEYYKCTDDDKNFFLIRIKTHLNSGSNFTAFKRWIVRDNNELNHRFSKYFD